MPSTRTVPADLIDHIEADLDQAPEVRSDQITKQQAVSKLRRSILAMRAKGYSLDAIARMLSERGLAVSPVMLRLYLKGAEASQSGKGRDLKKAATKSQGDRTPAAAPRKPASTAKEAPEAHPAAPAETPTAAVPAQRTATTGKAPAKETEGPAGAKGATTEAAAAKAPDNRAATPRSAPERRSAFTLREDTEKI
jgi:hypothetical protein